MTSGEAPTPRQAPKGTREDAEQEVLGAFVDGWQALTADTFELDEDKAARTSAESALRDELALTLNAENLVVLAGLGTSLGLASADGNKSAPRMSDLWSAVEELHVFTAAAPKLSSSILATKNLEHVLSDAQARLALTSDDPELGAFVTQAEDLVLDRCSFVDDDSDVTSHEIFLRKVARRSTRLQRTQLFTTNYDLAFETAARRSRFNVIDGFGFGGQEFDGGLFDLDYVRRRPNEQLALEPSVFHLLKLHGSVDWDSDERVVRKTRARPKAPVLIYPSVAKYQLSYQQPYLEFMSRFQIALRQPDVGLIVVGFGFNDYHLVAPIEAALRSNIGLRAIVVTPGARSAERSECLGWIEDLILRGDRRLTLLKATFDDLVRRLPEVPPMEERDAHTERVSQRRFGDSR